MTEVTIKVSSRLYRLAKMPKLMKHCWKFTDHPSKSFWDRVEHCFDIFKIVMR